MIILRFVWTTNLFFVQLLQVTWMSANSTTVCVADIAKNEKSVSILAFIF